MRQIDFDMDEALTCEIVAECAGTRRSLVVRLARQGLLDTVDTQDDELLLTRQAVVQLRRMLRLKRDLGVKAAIIIDLSRRIRQLNRELEEMRKHLNR